LEKVIILCLLRLSRQVFLSSFLTKKGGGNGKSFASSRSGTFQKMPFIGTQTTKIIIHKKALKIILLLQLKLNK
jgi:hypothetical protein